MDYKFQINLQSICLVKVAVNLWQQRHVQNSIKLYTLNRMQSQKNEKKWNEITAVTMNLADNLKIPVAVKQELKYIIYCTGLRIVEWIKFLRQNISLSFRQQHLNDFETFTWTHYGTVDKLATFQNWLDHNKLDVTDAFNLACYLCLKDHILNLWQCIPDDVRDNEFYNSRIYQDYRYHLIAYWKAYCEEELEVLMDLLEFDEYDIYDHNSTPEKNMFKLCIEQQHNERGVKYFWHKLTDLDQRELLTDAFIPIEMVMSISAQITYDFKVDDCAESVVFILNEVTKSDPAKQLQVILEHKYLLLDLLSSTWPWHEYFFITLDLIWDYLTEYEYKNLLKNIIIKMLREFCFENFEAGTRYQEMLRQFWNKSPCFFKESIYLDDDNTIFWRLIYESRVESNMIELVCYDEENGASKYDLVNEDDWLGNKLLGLIYNQTVSLLVNGKDIIRYGTDEEKAMIQDMITSLSIFEMS